MAYNDNSYGLFQGAFYLQERTYNGGDLTGYIHQGDVDMFTIDPKQKFDDIQESGTGLGITSAHILTETMVSVKFRALDIRLGNWIRATWGGGAAVASGTVSGESITLYNGQLTKLAHPGVSSVVLTTTPSLTVGTDYVVDAVNGTLTVPTTSTNVVAGTPVTGTAAYSRAAYNAKVGAFTTGQRYYRALLVGRNVAQGNQPVIITVNQIAFDMANVLNLIEKKHINFEMSGMCLQDTLVALPVAATDPSQFFTIQKA